MKTFALLVCCLTLTFATIGCKSEEPKPAEPAAPAATETPAAEPAAETPAAETPAS